MSEPDPSLMLWEKRKRVKPVTFQVESTSKKRKTTPPSSAPKSTAKREKKTKKVTKRAKKKSSKVEEDDDEDSKKSKPKPVKKVVKDKTKTKAKEVPKERKPTTKVLEEVNNLIGTTFFEEDASYWTNEEQLHDLLTLRKMWQLPAACFILWLLQEPLKLKTYQTLREYEMALLQPEHSPVLEDVFTKLLLSKTKRERLKSGLGLPYSWWSQKLEDFYDDKYKKLERLTAKAKIQVTSEDEDDEGSTDMDMSEEEIATMNELQYYLSPIGPQNPLSTCSYKDLGIEKRMAILLHVCESVLQNQTNLDYVREMQIDDLRIQPIGTDRLGNAYYFFPQFYRERRIYRLSDSEGLSEAKSISWELWAKGLDSIQSFRDALGLAVKKGQKHDGERSLIEHLDAMLESLREEKVEEQKIEDKLLKRAILEALPRKRSARIQVKTLVKYEEDQQKQQQAQAEQAEREERMRFELLLSMEREKELERKKMIAMREERLAMKHTRDTRRQKQLQLEEQELLRERQELEKKQKQRARQKQQGGNESDENESDAESDAATSEDQQPVDITRDNSHQSSAD